MAPADQYLANPRTDWSAFCSLIQYVEPGFTGYRIEPNYFRSPGADYTHVSLGQRSDGITVQIVFERPREAGADAAELALRRDLDRLQPGRPLQRRDRPHRAVLLLFEPLDVAASDPWPIMAWYLR